MRFDLELFRQIFPHLSSFSFSTLFAMGGVALATLIVIYGALFGTGEASVEADTVAVAGPVFTPVAVTPPAPTPAANTPGADASAAPEFGDPRSVAHAVQTGLKHAGCYSGPLNGIWTASTQAAMGEFTARVNARLPVDRADPVLLALLETHKEVSCTEGAAPPAHSAEVAGAETTRPAAVVRTEIQTSSLTRENEAGANRVGYSAEDRRALDTLASADPEPSELDATSAAGAAAAAAAAVTAPKVTKRERRRASRKYRRQPSVARQVSRSLRSLQRSLNKLF